MTSLIATSAVIPVLASPNVRSEQISQLVLGETAEVLQESGEWRRIRGRLDGYEGWVHSGYASEVEAAGWGGVARSG